MCIRDRAHALSDYEWIWYSCKNAFFEDSKVTVLSFYDNGKKTCLLYTSVLVVNMIF